MAMGQGSEARWGRIFEVTPLYPQPQSHHLKLRCSPSACSTPRSALPAWPACHPQSPGPGDGLTKQLGIQPWLGQQGALELLEWRTNGVGPVWHLTWLWPCSPVSCVRLTSPGGQRVTTLRLAGPVLSQEGARQALCQRFHHCPCPELPGVDPASRLEGQATHSPAPSVLPAPPCGPRASHSICFEALELPKACSGCFLLRWEGGVDCLVSAHLGSPRTLGTECPCSCLYAPKLHPRPPMGAGFPPTSQGQAPSLPLLSAS